MKNDLVSVIVAICNVELYIRECIESIIQQTYENIEIILVDDGSTDNSSLICDEYEKIDNRIVVIHKQNGGLVSARKKGLDVASGDYVIFIDGDDSLETGLCENMLQHIKDMQVDFVHATYFENGEKISNIVTPELFEGDIGNKLQILKRYVFNVQTNDGGTNVITPSIWSKIFTCKFIKECYMQVPDSQSMGEDLICLVYLILDCRSFAVIPEAYYHYRVREESMSHKRGVNMILKISDLYKCLVDIFKKVNCIEQIKGCLDKWYIDMVGYNMEACLPTEIHMNRYYIEDVSFLYRKKIILYGAGKVGRDYYDQLVRYEQIEVIDWVDIKASNIGCTYRNIKGVERLRHKDYDVILIAVLRNELVNEITNQLIQSGVDKKTILWIKPKVY